MNSQETTQPLWQAQVLAAIEELNEAKTPTETMAAIEKLQPLFSGNGELTKAAGKCLALIRRVQRLEARHLREGGMLPIRFCE